MELLGEFELNNVYCGDSYKLIKEIPDKSVDCIYTDIPYLYQQGSTGQCGLSQRLAKRKLELMGFEANYMDAKGAKRSEALQIAKNAAKKHLDYISIENGIDYAILDDFVRIMKKVNCFIWCSKMQIFDIMKYFIEKVGIGVGEKDILRNISVE